MNANFGLILKKADRMRLLSAVVETRAWGDEIVETGVVKYKYSGLEDVFFQIYPLTDFVLNKLPETIRNESLEYIWMDGFALDAYEKWLAGGEITGQLSDFEEGIKALLQKTSFCAVMFAAEGERLQQFAYMDESEFISLLRKSVRDIFSSNGFLAVLNCTSRDLI